MSDKEKVKAGLSKLRKQNAKVIAIRNMIALARIRSIEGAAGKDGVNGMRGLDGLDGINGINGTNGFDGMRGEKGMPGLKGDIGAVGPQGDKGEAGMIWRGTYRSDIEYWIGDVVGVNGSAYVCIAATNQAPPVGFGWELLVSRGAQGVRGIKGEAGSGAAIDLPVSILNGGTGQTTQKAAIDALLPDQAGNTNYLLKTNGVSVSWTPLEAPALTLTGATLASNVVTSSLTSTGTLAALTVTATIAGSIDGNAATATTAGTVTNPNLTGEVTTSGLTATLANSAVIGKVLTGYTSGAGTVAATDTILQAIQKLNGNAGGGAVDAGTLTGATLASNVLASSLTSVGTLANLTVTNTITGSVSGSAATATSATTAGTVTTAAQPAITSVGTLTGLTVSATIAGSINGNAATATSATSASTATTAGTVTTAAQPAITSVGTLTGLTVTNTIVGSINGNAATATSATSATTAGTVTTAAQPSITSVGTLTGLTVSATITGSVSGNAATVTTNANLTGHITSTGNAAVLGSFTSAQLRTALTDETGTGAAVFAATPTFTTSVVGSASMDVFNTTSTTVNGFGAATAMTLGATTGSAAIRNPILYLGNTTNTIATNSADANQLSIAPFGNLVLAPNRSSVVDGDFAVLTITNLDQALGQVQIEGGDLFLGNKSDGSVTTPVNIVFEGATGDANETTLTVTDPTVDRTITLPDATGTVALTANKLSAFAATTSSELAGVISDETGTGALVFATNPVLVTPNLGTPSALVGTNISGTGASFTAGTVTNPNLTGEVTTSGLTATVTNSAVIGKVITGYVSGAGTVAATDTILQAIQKLNGNAGGGGPADAGTLTGATLASNVLASSLTSVGTLASLTVTATIVGSVNGNAATATTATSATTAGTVTTAAQTNITSVGTLTGLTLSGNVNHQDNVISRAEFLDYFERFSDLGDFTTASTQIALDLSTAQVFRSKITVTCTGLNVTNIPDNGNANAVGFSLLFVGDGTARTMTWNIGATAVTWAGGTAPTYTSANNKTDVFSFLTRDGGTTWFGFVGGQNY